MIKKKRNIKEIVNNIKKTLDRKGLNTSEFLIYKKTNKTDFDISIIENEIEKGLITARTYSNPTTFLPMNPITKAIKKAILLTIRVYTKSQIVFNQNILYSANKLYQYFLHFFHYFQESQIESSKKIDQLERRIKILEERIKNNA